ncbi:MAG: hypothetical protein A2Y80_00200 [Deltaproteobacteria bacterium RBG_13_58_19]|nr:MAG: hypothetical protein A2Y80_00200 [Deltaproteobacteria bacterium RBG_13_58_19]
MQDFPFSRYLAFGTPYVFAVSVLYLYGFWSNFNLNIFEFISINDVIRLSIFSILFFVGSLLIGHLLGMAFLGDVLPPGGGADTSIGRFGRKYWKYLVGIVLILIIIINRMIQNPNKWFIIAVLIGNLSLILTHLDFFIQLIPNPQARSSILVLLFLIMGISHAEGRVEGARIIEGKAKYIIDLQQSKLDGKLSGDYIVAFVGLAGSRYILFGTQTKRIFIVNAKDTELIVLAPNPALQGN